MKSACTFTSKLTAGISIFSQIGQLAAEHNAINLWQGSPSFTPDNHLLSAVSRAMTEGFNQYAPMQGERILRQVLAEKTWQLYGADYDPENEVTVTVGGLEAIYATITALVHHNDEVIIFEPAFECYAPAIRLQGATPVAMQIPLDTLKIDWIKVAAAITAKTRMIIINSPHNPTGALLDLDDIEQLIALTRGSHIVILSDEVYEHMVYDGKVHYSMCRFPELAERSVVISSLGKSYSVTGWRIGYCVAPAEIMLEIRKVHQYMVFSAAAPFQRALATALSDPSSYLGLAALYQRKRDLLIASMEDSGLTILPCSSGFFLLARINDDLRRSDTEFVFDLVRNHGVGTIPLSSFYGDANDTGIIRISFCKDDNILREGGKALAKYDL